MALDIIFVLAGLALACLTLSDVFKTVVEPGGSDAWLRIARRTVFALLPPWKRYAGQVTGMFAPLVLVLSFLVWLCLLILGFGLMAYGVRGEFQPPLKSIWDALYFVGSSIVTIGLSETSALGAGRWVILSAGFCGLAVITLAVTYLLLVQSSVAQRDTGIIKLNTVAGEPPSALALLENFAQLRNTNDLPELIHQARDWSATVRQSHSTHPSLIYFVSVGAGVGWPAAVGTLIDLGLFTEQCLDDRRLHGPGVLLTAEARGMAESLAQLAGLSPKLHDTSEDQLRAICSRLRKAGYRLKDDIDFESFARSRAQAQASVAAMAEHLGTPTTLLVP